MDVAYVIIPILVGGYGFMAWWVKRLYSDLEECRKAVDECRENRLADAKEYELEIRELLQQIASGGSHEG